MARYTVSGRSSAGAPLVTVSIDGIEQENPVIAELEIVNAVRTTLLTVPGVVNVLARRYQQVITQV